MPSDDCPAGGTHHYVAVEEGADIGDEDFDGPLVCVKCGDSDVDRYNDSYPPVASEGSD